MAESYLFSQTHELYTPQQSDLMSNLQMYSLQQIPTYILTVLMIVLLSLHLSFIRANTMYSVLQIICNHVLAGTAVWEERLKDLCRGVCVCVCHA